MIELLLAVVAFGLAIGVLAFLLETILNPIFSLVAGVFDWLVGVGAGAAADSGSNRSPDCWGDLMSVLIALGICAAWALICWWVIRQIDNGGDL